jgi:hypothetical protein
MKPANEKEMILRNNVVQRMIDSERKLLRQIEALNEKLLGMIEARMLVEAHPVYVPEIEK